MEQMTNETQGPGEIQGPPVPDAVRAFRWACQNACLGTHNAGASSGMNRLTTSPAAKMNFGFEAAGGVVRGEDFDMSFSVMFGIKF